MPLAARRQQLIQKLLRKSCVFLRHTCLSLSRAVYGSAHKNQTLQPMRYASSPCNKYFVCVIVEPIARALASVARFLHA